jgi:lysophospholipase II
MSGFPSPHVIPPLAPHTHTIILLHGRGSNGPEFAEELFEARTSKELSLQEHLPGWKWVFPTSQTRFSTLFQEDISEWFDIYSLTDPTLREELQTEGLQQSVAFIRQLIDEEISAVGGDALRIVLGGISQGCATAVRVMLSSRRLGAFVGFCSWMPSPSDIPDICSNRDTPVFLSHTKDDRVVDFKLGLQLRNTLQQQLGMNVTWRAYNDGGHWIKESEGFDDLTGFLASTFAATCSDNLGSTTSMHFHEPWRRPDHNSESDPR